MKKSLYAAAALGAAVLLAGHDDAEASSKTYKVKSGDSLSLIASKYNMTTTALKKLNKLTSDMIYVNQVLKITGSPNSTNSSKQTTTQKKPTSSSSSSSYTVKSGDYLYAIATKYRMSVDQLKKLNKLSSDHIYIGQKLKITGKITTTSNPVKPTTPTKKPVPTKKPTSTTGTSSYTVKSGDSLSAIANRYNTTVASITQLNHLKSTVIYVGQSLKLTGKVTVTKPTTPTKPTITKPTKPTTSTSQYTVKSGDSLSAIASRYNISTAKLMSLNSLTGPMIYVGQKLKVSGSVTTTKPNTGNGNSTVNKPTTPVGNPSTSSSLITNAKKYLGVPYAWGGTNPNGFDCSGFIYYIFNQSGKSISRTNAVGYYSLATPISSPKVGDLVFFKNTYKIGITHLGIYMGNGMFIHAGGDRVQISSVSENYWASHFAGYGRLN
ncbi:C40 family peptidase [Kurthia sibirica]|uniref:C40 family peptidase n=1 Tax=Kurthia sibirica TaxID=202750 RepID=UPI0011691F05|nr:peptidoglycan endopeptidase [Kurthia sibirica]GEK35113.1 peptidoglycan endopeptidase LytF [Kurthia sibirica]